MAAHSGVELHPLVGRSRQGPLGLFPLFSASFGSVTVVFSPPPNPKVSYLGPVYISEGFASDRSHEQLRAAFIDAVAEFVEESIDPQYVHVRTEIRRSACSRRCHQLRAKRPTSSEVRDQSD